MLSVGQVMWLRTVLNVRGAVSDCEHPYLIYKNTKINEMTAATFPVADVSFILSQIYNH